MRKVKNLLLSLSVCLIFTSCTITTAIPNVLKGQWVRYEEKTSVYIDHEFVLNSDFTYTHTVQTSDLDKVEYEGLYEYNLTSFSITGGTGVIKFIGKEKNDNSTDGSTSSEDVTENTSSGDEEENTENKEYYFTWVADPDLGPWTLKLVKTDLTHSELNLYYYGGATQ